MGDAIARSVVTNDVVTSEPVASSKVTGPPGVAVIPGLPASSYAIKSSSASSPDHVTSPGTPRYDWFWRPDGLRVWTRWFVAVGGGNLKQYDVPSAYSFTGWGSPTVNLTIGGSNIARSLSWADSGNFFYLLNRTSGSFRAINRYDQSATPYDLTSLGTLTSASNIATGSFGHAWKPDGTVLFIEHTAGFYDQLTVSTPFDITTIVTTPVVTFDSTVDAGSRSSADLAFSADGLKLYSVTAAGLLCSWDLAAPYDFTVAPTNFTTGVNVNLPTTLAVPRGIFYRPDNGDILIERDQGTQIVRCWET
jgi:hypothetical protein